MTTKIVEKKGSKRRFTQDKEFMSRVLATVPKELVADVLDATLPKDIKTELGERWFDIDADH